MKEGVVERFSSEMSSLNKHGQVLHHLALSAEVVKLQWTERILKVLVLVGALFSYVKIFFHLSFLFV